MLQETFKMKAKTYEGLEDVLGRELMRMGAEDVDTDICTVTFSGDKFLLYQANYELRTALKIYKEISRFEFNTSDEFYAQFKEYRWSKILNIYKSFRVEVTGTSEVITVGNVKADITKIICDYFNEKSHKMPPHDNSNPSVVIVIEVDNSRCSFLLDASGTSLAHRGYKVSGGGFPYDEVYAAGLVQLTGWKANTNFIVPHCGAGTLLIEATMLAYNIPAQICRESFGFFSWRDFDESLWTEVKNSARLAVKHNGEFAYKLLGYETDETLVKAASQNIKKAMLDKYIEVQMESATDAEAPEGDTTVMVIAPKINPFNVEETRAKVDTLSKLAKRTYKNAKVWIHTDFGEMPKAIGIQPRKENEIKYNAEENKLALY
jgi:putative N6-adenine-specific DNA methylase